MKTSNKILLTLALAMILLPLLTMIYDSKANYVASEDYAVQEKNRAKEDANFNTPSKEMESKTIASPFTSIHIEDAKKMGVYIHYIKSPQYGVKVSKLLKDSIDFNVDAKGQLEVNFKNTSAGNNHYYVSILVYAPSVKALSIKNTKSLMVNANVDSLNLNVVQSANISFDKDAVIKSLIINADKVENINAWESKVANLTLKINNSNFTSTRSSYEYLSIDAAGKTNITIAGDNEKKNTIKNLALTTLGTAAVKLEDVQVANCSGSLSDQTLVQMPAINLNQMYKNKK